jgi:outer membrane protein OmpA-like peptidoglycan-associated protein
VTVLDGATAVATGTANDRGDWSVVTEYKFANTDPKISVREGNALPKAAAVAPDNASLASSSTRVEDHVPPAAQLLKNFENPVAETREEAKKQGSATIPLKDEAPHASASAAAPLPASPSAIPIQPQSIANPAQPPRSPPASTVLIPITFVYNEAKLTPEGQGAARLLLEYLKLKKFASVTLSGHADERGLPNYNMELSHQRLITVEHVLRAGGFEGKLDLIPKGSTEPFTGIDRSKFSSEEVYQLDRRVELRVAN